MNKDIKANDAIISNPESAALKQARHFHDLFMMAVVQNGGSLVITEAAWIESAKYNKIERTPGPRPGTYRFTAVKKDGK